MKGQMNEGHLRAVPFILEVAMDLRFPLRINKVVLIRKGV